MPQPQDPILKKQQQQIKDKQDAEPHIAAKIASDVIVDRVVGFISNNSNHKNNASNAHLEAFIALGSLAGYACQQSALMAAQQEGDQEKPSRSDDVEDRIMPMSDEQGNQYYCGAGIEDPLLEDDMSVQALVSEAVPMLTVNDLLKIGYYAVDTIGRDTFGQPRLPEGYAMCRAPREYLKQLWQPLKTDILDTLSVPHADWSIAYAFAIQNLIKQTADLLSPTVAGTIVMECAIMMSQINLDSDYILNTRDKTIVPNLTFRRITDYDLDLLFAAKDAETALHRILHDRDFADWAIDCEWRLAIDQDTGEMVFSLGGFSGLSYESPRYAYLFAGQLCIMIEAFGGYRLSIYYCADALRTELRHIKAFITQVLIYGDDCLTGNNLDEIPEEEKEAIKDRRYTFIESKKVYFD